LKCLFITTASASKHYGLTALHDKEVFLCQACRCQKTLEYLLVRNCYSPLSSATRRRSACSCLYDNQDFRNHLSDCFRWRFIL